MSFGETLKAARERRRVSLDDAAKVTKINRPYLVALECERVDKLPAGIYRHGFLRTYAEFLKLNPAPLLKDLDALLQPETQEIIVTEKKPEKKGIAALFRIPTR